MKLHVKHHNPDPAYIRSLIEGAGVSQREAARRLGIDERTMRRYLHRPSAPYLVQFALENL